MKLTKNDSTIAVLILISLIINLIFIKLFVYKKICAYFDIAKAIEKFIKTLNNVTFLPTFFKQFMGVMKKGTRNKKVTIKNLFF